MVDFRYRVNGGAWTILEGETIPKNLPGTLATDIVDVQPFGAIVTLAAAPVVDPFASATYDLDFRLSAPKTGGTFFTYIAEAGNFVGGLYELESDGSLVSVGGSTLQRNSDGLEVWPDRTNRAIQNRDFTNASWTKTNVTAARSTGRNNGANAGSRITVTTDGGTAMLPAITLASSTQIGSVDIKRVTGTGTIEMTMDGGASWVTLTGTGTTWTRPSIPAQTVTNPQVGFRFGTSGDVFDIDYVQLENSNTVGPRIATTTASVNRPQNRATVIGKPPIVDLIKTDTFTAYWEGKLDFNGGRALFVSDANFGFWIAADGSCAALGLPAGSFTFGTYQKVAFCRNSGTASIRCSANGGAVTSASHGSNAAFTHFDIATNGVGAFNGRGKVRRVSFWNTQVSDATLQALTS